jgi:hypothetical protein
MLNTWLMQSHEYPEHRHRFAHANQLKVARGFMGCYWTFCIEIKGVSAYLAGIVCYYIYSKCQLI